jgi:CRISPR-associated protein Cas5h
MQATCFEIRAPFGTFKDPRTTRGYFSFPFPPKTALQGLMAGVLGIPHNECYKADHFLSKAKVAVQMLAMPQFVGCRSNETQTKAVQVLGGTGGIKIGFPSPGSDRGFSSPQTSTYLANVSYRVFVSMDEKNAAELTRRLEAHEYVFPPYLGRANMLAELEYIGALDMQPASTSSSSIHVISVFDIQSVAAIDGSYVIIPRMPNGYEVETIEYKIDKQKLSALKVKTRSLVSMAYGKDGDFQGISVTPNAVGAKLAYRIAAFKSRPELVGKYVLFFPD